MKPSSMAYTIWGIAAMLWLAVQIAHAAGIRINHTPSLAVGLWRITPRDGPLRRGQIVSFCPPDGAALREARRRFYIGFGSCPGGYEPMLKEVIAIAGDVVRLDAAGVAVNGRPLPRSRRLDTDAAGQPVLGIAHGTMTLAPDSFWAGAFAHPRSFDSRYFGPVPSGSIIGAAAPLLRWCRSGAPSPTMVPRF
jgi:conjugative transfer signal peptidase TraF